MHVYSVVIVRVNVCCHNWTCLTGSITLVDHWLNDSTPRVDEPETDGNESH